MQVNLLAFWNAMHVYENTSQQKLEQFKQCITLGIFVNFS